MGIRAKGESLAAYALLSPAILIALLFVYVPAFDVLLLSFQDWNLIGTDRGFAGLDNYAGLVSTGSDFPNAMIRTLEYGAIYIPASLAVGLGAALLLQRLNKGAEFFQVLYFVPSVTSIAVIAVVWSYLYNPQVGFFNSLLSMLGVGADRLPEYLNDPRSALPAIATMGVWQSSGFVMLLCYTGLQGIPKHYHEAAAIDGAPMVLKFRKIVLPMLSPTLFFVVFMLLINSFQVFGPVAIMTRGRPLGSTDVVLYYIYRYAFQFFKAGPASAASCIAFAAIFLCAAFQMKFGERSVFYQ